MANHELSEDSILDSEGNLLLRGEDRTVTAEDVARLRSEFPGVIEELQLHREAYVAWRASGSEAHDALLEIWHRAEPEDTSHMTYGDDTEAVVEAVVAALHNQRNGLLEKEIEAFELVIDAAESLEADTDFTEDSRNSDPQWEAGYRASASDLAAYLRQKVTSLRESLES